MIRMERVAYYGPKAGIHYAMGWSMIYFLEESEEVAQHTLWPQILPVYFDALKESAVREKAWLPATLGILSEEAYETAARAREHALESRDAFGRARRDSGRGAAGFSYCGRCRASPPPRS
jgi:hypothetical protein